MSSAFSDLAAKMKATQARLKDQVRELDTDLDSVAAKGDEIVRRQKAVIDQARAGIKEMEEGLRELEGNGEPQEEGGSNIATFQPGSKTSLGTG